MPNSARLLSRTRTTVVQDNGIGALQQHSDKEIRWTNANWLASIKH